MMMMMITDGPAAAPRVCTIITLNPSMLTSRFRALYAAATTPPRGAISSTRRVTVTFWSAGRAASVRRRHRRRSPFLSRRRAAVILCGLTPLNYSRHYTVWAHAVILCGLTPLCCVGSRHYAVWAHAIESHPHPHSRRRGLIRWSSRQTPPTPSATPLT